MARLWNIDAARCSRVLDLSTRGRASGLQDRETPRITEGRGENEINQASLIRENPNFKFYDFNE